MKISHGYHSKSHGRCQYSSRRFAPCAANAPRTLHHPVLPGSLSVLRDPLLRKRFPAPLPKPFLRHFHACAGEPLSAEDTRPATGEVAPPRRLPHIKGGGARSATEGLSCGEKLLHRNSTGYRCFAEPLFEEKGPGASPNHFSGASGKGKTGATKWGQQAGQRRAEEGRGGQGQKVKAKAPPTRGGALSCAEVGAM